MESSVISLDCNVYQNKGNIVSDMDGEKVMFNIENGKYYNLGVIGGTIWGLIENPVSIKQLVNLLMEEYEIQQNECQTHVTDFLQQLLNENLILIKST